MVKHIPLHTHDNPPSNWAGATPLGHDVYYLIDDGSDGDGRDGEVATWHWCTAYVLDDEPGGRWALAYPSKHDVLSLDPLHLEPSLLWHCCGTHGFIRNGEWTPA